MKADFSYRAGWEERDLVLEVGDRVVFTVPPDFDLTTLPVDSAGRLELATIVVKEIG